MTKTTCTINASEVKVGDAIKMRYGNMTVVRIEWITDLRLRIYFSDDVSDSILRFNNEKLEIATAEVISND